jgi:hypothetical protein
MAAKKKHEAALKKLDAAHKKRCKPLNQRLVKTVQKPL